MADFNGFKKNGETYIPNDATARASISTIEGKIPSAASSSNKLVDTTTMNTALAGKVDNSKIGANNGIAELDANGRVPSSQLPSYVDDVLEYASQSAFPATGETGKIYIALDTNKTYRWSGSAYVEISESLALGETSSTAYAGNKGKANADAIAAMKDGSSIDSFGDVETALAGKVDKVTGKGLSTNDYDNTEKAKVAGAFPRSEQAVLGAKNLLPYPYTDKGNKTDNGITFIDNGDGTITAKAGIATANAQYYIAGSSSEITRSVEDLRGKYFSKGLQSTGITLVIWYYDANKAYISGQGATEKGILFEIPTNAVYYSILIRVNSGTVIENDTDIKPMISLNGGDYVPYAMTNRELTEKKISIADLQTITAASSDFADFQTRIAAL